MNRQTRGVSLPPGAPPTSSSTVATFLGLPLGAGILTSRLGEFPPFKLPVTRADSVFCAGIRNAAGGQAQKLCQWCDLHGQERTITYPVDGIS